jgi:hypothetical protein
MAAIGVSRRHQAAPALVVGHPRGPALAFAGAPPFHYYPGKKENHRGKEKRIHHR